jgi:schlafen family protein
MSQVFTKSLDSITYGDVIDICQQQKPATLQFDYLSSARDPNAAQHIAAMANTFGGLIIFGVAKSEEGLPISWKGLVNNNLLEKEVHELLNQIQPCPQYRIYKTNARQGKTFILLHIDESHGQPCLTQTDPHTVWLRSGKIEQPLEAADRKAINELRHKQQASETAKTEALKIPDRLLAAQVEEAETKRLENRSPDDGYSVYIPHLLDQTVLLKLLIHPAYPEQGLVGSSPKDLRQTIKNLYAELQHTSSRHHFPALEMQPMPGGVAAFRWHENDYYRDVSHDQFYTNGIIFHAHNALYSTEQGTVIDLTSAAREVEEFLVTVGKLYQRLGYYGALEGLVKLERTKGHYVQAAYGEEDMTFPSSLRKASLDSYEWTLKTTTYELGEDTLMRQKYAELLEKIHWDMQLTTYSPTI